MANHNAPVIGKDVKVKTTPLPVYVDRVTKHQAKWNNVLGMCWISRPYFINGVMHKTVESVLGYRCQISPYILKVGKFPAM